MKRPMTILSSRQQKIGELNGGWAVWFKIQLALVPMLTMSLIGGGVFQIIHNTRVDTFMQRTDFYTHSQSLQDHISLRAEFMARQDSLEKTVDAMRLALQVATPEADRRLKLIEQSLTSIQSDVVSMRISLAQIRLSGSSPSGETKDKP